MAHPIESNETIPKAIRRLARADLRKARKDVSDKALPFPEQIHAIRTALKKVRALARMVRPTARRAAGENKRLRKLGRSIGPVREAEVLLSTFDKLTQGWPDRKRDSLRRLRAHLAERLREATLDFQHELGLRSVSKRLARARRRARRWVPKRDDWRTIEPGLLADYRRAQDTMNQAYRTLTGPDFHAWRRAVKAHRHQVHALLETRPAELVPRVEKLDRLGDLLGDEHDLTTLESVLTDEPALFRDPNKRERILGALEQRRNRLRARAKRLGRELFAEDRRTFRLRLKRAFNVFHGAG